MEMFIIAVVAVAAFAAVLIPLFRRGTRSPSDAREFDMGADPPESDPLRGRGVVPPMAAGPATPVAPPAVTNPDAPAEPTLPDAQRRAELRPEPSDASPAKGLERDVARYRQALRAGTLCGKCGEANPPGSRFCGDCGADLAGPGDEQEFA
jgi:hypothetical protein